jgi:hypothetical protein
MLVNADTDANIRTLTRGSVTDLAALPTRRINFRAYTNLATVGSVRMVLNGTTRPENIAPYAWAGDNNGNLNPWTPPNGNYTLKVTAYCGSNGSGLAGKPMPVFFTVKGNSTTARLAAGDPDEALLNVYPNPATNRLYLQLAETAQPMQVRALRPARAAALPGPAFGSGRKPGGEPGRVAPGSVRSAGCDSRQVVLREGPAGVKEKT